MNNQATPAVEVERHSATALRFATGDLAKAEYVDAKHLDTALERLADRDALLRDIQRSHGVMLMSNPPQDPWAYNRIDSRISAMLSGAAPVDQYQTQPAQLRFPAMLRKMWSGGEVQQWLEEQGPLYRHPLVTQGDSATLQKVYDVFGTGALARTPSTLLTCLGNVKRFSDYLHAIEREFFMVPGEPSEEPEDAGCEPDDDCLVNRWGAPSTEHYVEQFRTALMLISKPAGEPVAYIQFGEADSGEIGDYEIEPNREVCEALNVADNGNATIYDLYLFPHHFTNQNDAKQ